MKCEVFPYTFFLPQINLLITCGTGLVQVMPFQIHRETLPKSCHLKSANIQGVFPRVWKMSHQGDECGDISWQGGVFSHWFQLALLFNWLDDVVYIWTFRKDPCQWSLTENNLGEGKNYNNKKMNKLNNYYSLGGGLFVPSVDNCRSRVIS